jgi:hypothetical protein
VISCEPLNDALPLKSPPKLIVLAVSKVVAVLALPVKLPAVSVISDDPLKDALPLKVPPKDIALGVAKVVAVAAFPDVLALIVEGKLNVTLPADADTSTSLAVPRILVTPVFAIVRVPAPSL